MKKIYYLFILLFSFQTSLSQTHIYKHFGVDEGLPSTEVYDIYQDKQGYIWFATDKGLSRYNGYEFENFTTEDGLPDNTIFDFFPQENGQVWCYGYQSQQLFYFDEVFKGFKVFQYNDVFKDLLHKKSIIKSLIIGKNRTLSIGGYAIRGLIKINKKGELRLKYNSDTFSETVPLATPIQLGIDPQTQTFFSLYDTYKPTKNLQIIKAKNSPSGKLKLKALNDSQYLFIDRKLGLASKTGEITYYKTGKNPIGISPINHNTFFVGYYKNGAEIRAVSGKVIDNFLPKKSVSNFLIDKQGSYWFTTIDDGVFYIKNPKIKVFNNEHISSLVKDHNNQLYAGYYNGTIAKLNIKNIDTLYNALSQDQAYVEFDKKNNHLYGYSDHRLTNYTLKKLGAFSYARKLPEHIANPILSLSVNTYLKLINDSIVTIKINKNIQDVSSYNNNDLIGTSSGLYIRTPNDSLTSPTLDILKKRIDDVDINKNTNTAYLATQGAGVVVYGNRIYNITEKNGLTNNIVGEVHIENDSTVWACTNTGLNKITFHKNNTHYVQTITKADGLLSNDIDDIEISNDTVWVATKKGLCYFKKDILTKKYNTKITSLNLKSCAVNHNLFKGNFGRLNYTQNNIDFNIEAISHGNTNEIKYLYRLKEIDTSWTTTTNRTISFPSLSPGKYTFEAKASVLNNVSKNTIRQIFKIAPPFWKSWWFYSLCLLLVSALIYVFFKFRILSYNRAIISELIRLLVKRLKRKEQFYCFRSNGEDFKIPSRAIQYVNSQGNYLDIKTSQKTYTIRCKIGDFIETTPDPLEYIRVHRSYIIRIDKVTSKGKNWVVIKEQKIPVGETYLQQLKNIQF